MSKIGQSCLKAIALQGVIVGLCSLAKYLLDSLTERVYTFGKFIDHSPMVGVASEVYRMLIQDDAGWKKLLAYYIDCLHEEHRLHYVIESQDIQKTCWFLPHVDGSFLRNTSVFSISIQRNRETEIERLQRFVLGEPRSGGRPNVCFGYPVFVDSHYNLMPLFYVDVSSRQTDTGVWLTSESPEIEINRALGFDEPEAESGKTRFDQMLASFLSSLEKLSGEPVARVSRKHFESRHLPRHAVVECPLLFHARAGDTNLSRELGQLKEQHNWSTVQPALRRLLTTSDSEPYPEVPERAVDPRLYVVPASDSQRRAIAAAGQCPLTVIAGPRGTGRSQLVLNIVGDAVLGGETVLISSPNYEVVDVVFEHFVNEFNYPGVVQSGDEFPLQMLTTMRRALADVREGGIVSRLEQVRGEYEEMSRQIDEQRDSIALTEQLERDRQTYQLEMQDLLEALPELIRASVKRSRIRFGRDDGQQLDDAIRALLTDVQEIIAQRQALTAKVRAILFANRKNVIFLMELEDAERHVGISTSLRRFSIDLESFPAIKAHILAWEDLLQTLPLESRVRQLRAEMDNAEHQSQRKGLPAGLLAALTDAAQVFDRQREQSLRRDLEAIESEARKAASNYRQLLERIDVLRKRSEVVMHWLLGAMMMQAGDPAVSRWEDILDTGFAIQDDVLKAHRLGTVRADLTEPSTFWAQGRDGEVVELEDLLARLDEEFVAARTRLPALLLPKIEAAIAVADHRAWQNLAVQLEEVNVWATRIAAGDLTRAEHLRAVASRDWAVRQVQSELDALAVSNTDLFALNPVAAPPRKVPFRLWAEYVHTWNDFVQACALAAHRVYVRQTLASYQAQNETNARSAELQQVEASFADLLARLPAPVAKAMSEGDWPFGPVDETVVRDLDVLREQYRRLEIQYVGWTERLAALQRDQTVPEALQSALQTTGRATPLGVLDFISTWLRFSQAVEVEYEIRQLHPSLTEAETSLDALWARLPDGMRQELDWSRVPHSDDLLQPLRQHLSGLRAELVSQVEEWDRVQKRAVALLRHNEPNSHALGQALQKAHIARQSAKTPNYLSGLLDKTHECPEQLLDDLWIWQRMIQIWRLRAQRARVRTNLKERPSRDKAPSALARLLERRRDLAGQVLAEQWRRVVAELEPDAVRAIEQYLSAIEASAEGKADFADLKQSAEAHFHDALQLFPVWLTPDLSTRDIPLRAGLFDCVVIDETSQCDIPSALPLLLRGKRIVVIGDERQPSHVTTCADSVNRQLAERHDVGVGSSYDYKLHSLFALAVNSVTGGPGQILLDEH